MPTQYFLFIILFFSINSIAQVSPEQIVRYKINSIEKLPNEENNGNIHFLSAPYAQPVLTAKQLEQIKNKQVISVELLYTKFRRSASFNQIKLNLERIKNLRKILPNLFKDNKIDWQITEQTGAKDYTTGQTYFHGFLIRTRKELTAKERDSEIAEMKKEVEKDKSTKGKSTITYRDRNITPTYDKETVKFYNVGPIFSSDPCDLMDDAMAHIEYPKEASVREKSGRVQAQFTVNRQGDVQDIKITEGIGFGCDDAVKNYLKTMPKWTPARDKQEAVNAYVTLNFWFIMDESKLPASEMPCDLIIILPKGKSLDSLSYGSRSTAVSEIFSRQKNWNQVAVVCDVTGSMGPYMSDMLKWYRMNTAKIKHFTFFNDGDMTPDSRKAIGNTAGIYSTPAVSYEIVETEMYKAMRNGWGGDVPENDVEALLEAEKNAPFSDRLIWIADNYATPRDLSLLPKLTKPVSIVICSAKGGVSVDYLNIARQINATLHTFDSDLPPLANVREGERVIVDERQYELVNGKFVRIY